MEFYLILQEIMVEKGLKIPDVARKCGLSDGTIRSMITREQKNIYLEVAFKISNGLGVSLERLNGMPEKDSNSSGLESDKIPSSTADSTPGDIFTSIEQQYDSDTRQAFSMYVQLDQRDQGEVYGEMKQMLKSDKYKSDPCSKGNPAKAV